MAGRQSAQEQLARRFAVGSNQQQRRAPGAAGCRPSPPEHPGGVQLPVLHRRTCRPCSSPLISNCVGIPEHRNTSSAARRRSIERRSCPAGSSGPRPATGASTARPRRVERARHLWQQHAYRQRRGERDGHDVPDASRTSSPRVAHHLARPAGRADARADRRALAAADDRADDRAGARADADLRGVLLLRRLRPDATRSTPSARTARRRSRQGREAQLRLASPFTLPDRATVDHDASDARACRQHGQLVADDGSAQCRASLGPRLCSCPTPPRCQRQTKLVPAGSVTSFHFGGGGGGGVAGFAGSACAAWAGACAAGAGVAPAEAGAAGAAVAGGRAVAGASAVGVAAGVCGAGTGCAVGFAGCVAGGTAGGCDAGAGARRVSSRRTARPTASGRTASWFAS